MSELKRDFYDRMRQWKDHKNQECLLVKGARQIGKTFIVDKFGRENYQSYININFIDNPEFINVFAGNLDTETLLSGISALRPQARFIPGNTLIFLDEIQECPEARTALKFLALDNRYDVVASGSLLGIKYKHGRRLAPPKSIPVGYERQMTMHSLSFEEFLWAKGYSDAPINRLRDFFTSRGAVPYSENSRFHALLREYIVVGGMPEVVSRYIDNRHFGEVQQIQEKILTAYSDDIHKYAESPDIPKIANCFRAIPRILAKENRKFKYSEIEKGGTARKYLASVEWLKDAGLVALAECAEVPLSGLAAYVREDWFKLYMCDIGLLCAQYGMLAKRQILDGTLKGAMKGGIYENLLAGILQRSGFPLYYYKRDEKQIEMEFLVESADGVVPVEVKAQTGRTVSLDKMLTDKDIPYGYKFTGGNVGVSGKKITLPHYMAMFLRPLEN